MNKYRLYRNKLEAKFAKMPDLGLGLKRIVSLASATAIVFTSSLLISKLDRSIKNKVQTSTKIIESIIEEPYYSLEDLSLLTMYNKDTGKTLFYIVREVNSDTDSIDVVFSEFEDVEDFKKYNLNDNYTLFTRKYEFISIPNAYYYSCSFNGTSNYNGKYVHLIGSKDLLNLGVSDINYANVLTNIYEECPVFISDVKEVSIYEDNRNNDKRIVDGQNILIDLHKLTELTSTKDKEFSESDIYKIEANLNKQEEIRTKKNTKGAHLL